MKRPGTTFRIAFALAMLSATVLLCTRLAGLFDEDGARILASRTQLCESVAIACSQFASQGDSNGIEVSLASLVVRNADVTSAGYRDAGGQLVLSSGPHANNWELAPSKTSSQNCIYVPVMAGAETSGRVELCFKPIYESGLAGILSLPSVKVTLAATCINLLAFYWLLRRSLKHLDPSRVVPDRVRSALDTMAEGLLILDQKNQIVLANQSFAETVKSPVTDLQGMDVDRFSWELADDENRSFPWNEPQASGQPTRGRCMRLGTADGQRRTFLVNATTIRDDRGNDRGMMVSLDDVTEIERKNTELVKTLNALKTSQQEVREQNEKLQFLATRD
ncbi:MAG: PAS domain-containing protein, partial [Planctomycetales bacterium]|nr:PAS domain-containing protein [Planctomycetales bacterium]